MASSSKKRQTFAKVTRERTVREKRERKLEKKRAAAEARRAGIEPGEATSVSDETVAETDESSSGETVEPTSRTGTD